MGAILLQWIVIGAAAATAIGSHHWIAYVLAVFVIGTRQHALGVIAHDGAHFRLFHTRWLNDVVSDLFCAFPLGVSTGVFRQFHFEHHRYLNTSQDPELRYLHVGEEWLFPMLPWECAKLLFRDLLAVNLKFLGRMLWWWSPWPRLLGSRTLRYRVSSAERIELLLFVIAFAVVTITTHAWLYLLLLWILPFTTVFMFVNRVRSIAEHYGVEKEHELNGTRHVKAAWWERFIFCPCHVNYHLEHHLFPSVPFFNLPKLHLLLRQEEDFRRCAHFTDGYLRIGCGAIREVTCDHREGAELSPHPDQVPSLDRNS